MGAFYNFRKIKKGNINSLFLLYKSVSIICHKVVKLVQWNKLVRQGEREI